MMIIIIRREEEEDEEKQKKKRKRKEKCSCYRAGVTQRVGRGIALLFHDSGTRRG